MPKTGRPSKKTDALIDTILARLAAGDSLRRICRDEDMPARSNIMHWLDVDPDFAAKYARARDIGLDERADALAEDIEIESDVARARLKLDYGKWYLSKLAPKKYGERVATEHSGPDGGPVKFDGGEDLARKVIAALRQQPDPAADDPAKA